MLQVFAGPLRPILMFKKMITQAKGEIRTFSGVKLVQLVIMQKSMSTKLVGSNKEI